MSAGCCRTQRRSSSMGLCLTSCQLRRYCRQRAPRKKRGLRCSLTQVGVGWGLGKVSVGGNPAGQPQPG